MTPEQGEVIEAAVEFIASAEPHRGYDFDREAYERLLAAVVDLGHDIPTRGYKEYGPNVRVYQSGDTRSR